MARAPTTVLVSLLLVSTPEGSDLDEFKVKREPVFAFIQGPSVARQGDRVTLRSATKGHRDATVAIENPGGEIVRHLACGVLGPNAPAPFQKNSRQQTLVWDGKDDQGWSVDDPGVALLYPAYVAADTDRRLFIADHGSARILSVKLGYHKTAVIPLRDAAERTGR